MSQVFPGGSGSAHPRFLGNLLSSRISGATLITDQILACSWSISGLSVRFPSSASVFVQKACLQLQIITCLLEKSSSTDLQSVESEHLFVLTLRFYGGNDRYSGCLPVSIYIFIFLTFYFEACGKLQGHSGDTHTPSAKGGRTRWARLRLCHPIITTDPHAAALCDVRFCLKTPCLIPVVDSFTAGM